VNEKSARQAKRVLLGHISSVHGVKGWVKVHSNTDPRDAIFDYQPWLLGENERSIEVLEGKASGKHLLACLKGLNNRDDAEALLGQEIWVNRDALPDPEEHEYYWTDLIGLKVTGPDGGDFGTIKDMLATGANDVMVVDGDRQRLIPFVMGQYVKRVDLENGFVEVDWDAEF
jgi:16S rRNA processing protein RimM